MSKLRFKKNVANQIQFKDKLKEHLGFLDKGSFLAGMIFFTGSCVYCETATFFGQAWRYNR